MNEKLQIYFTLFADIFHPIYFGNLLNFCRPRSETLTLTGSHDLHEDNKGLNDDDNQLSDHSNTSESSSGFSSLPRSGRQEKQQPLTPKPHRTGM